jgi:hypothetical protein
VPKRKRRRITDENDATVELATIFLSDHSLVLSFNSMADASRAESPIPAVHVIVIGFASTPKLSHHQNGSPRLMHQL